LVPEARAKVAVLGAVKSPGYYPLDADSPGTVTQLIAQAGGTLNRAQIEQTALLRSTNGVPERVMVNLRRILREGKTDEDVVARDRDIIYVPPEKRDWDLILRALATVGVYGNWLF
jgi:protein involved in polysaccharide export with SLBB domain